MEKNCEVRKIAVKHCQEKRQEILETERFSENIVSISGEKERGRSVVNKGLIHYILEEKDLARQGCGM